MNMKKLSKILPIVACVALLALVALPALGAVGGSSGILGNLTNAQKDSGLGNKSLEATVGGMINVVLGLLGVVAVVIVLIGGFKYMIAGGNDEKVGDAKKWIISGIIGLAIVLSAYAITAFVVGGLVNATGTVE